MILVAPTAFKGTLAAGDVANAISAALRAHGHSVITLPLSDGGPGLLDALQHSAGGRIERVQVSGPLGDRVSARLLLQNGRTIIESADACGLHLVPESLRDPLNTSTYGVGELLLAAAQNADEVVIGLGGSATIDLGLGMASALGWRLQDAHGAEVARGGRGVLALEGVTGERPALPPVTALADVRNVLAGENGAARVFGAQKGATPDAIEALDRGLEQAAGVIARDVGVSVGALEGGGAAGGLGAGLAAFAGARLVRGSDWVLDAVGFDAALAKARVVVTGEGSYDEQSGMGKITGAVIERAGRHGVPVVLVAGQIGGALPEHVHAASAKMQLGLNDVVQLVLARLPRLLSA